MKCQHCNTDIAQEAELCSACGAPVKRLQDSGRSEKPIPNTLPDPLIRQWDPVEPPPTPLIHKAGKLKTAVETGEKVLGMDAETAGIVSLVLGIISLVFACLSTGCGGIFGIFGVVLGWMTLKTSGQQMGKWGLILNALALLGVLVAVGLMLAAIVLGISLGAAGSN